MKLVYFSFLSAIFSIIISCNENKSETAPKIIRTESLNPNGDSELAILMREMLAHAKYTKERIEDGLSEQTKFPENHLKLVTAKATSPEKRGEGFNEYAEAYLASLKELHTPNGMRIYNHNNLVNTCINCHKSFCTGPIPTIEKLIITNE